METLKKYPFTKELEEKFVLIKNISEFYYSLNHGKEFLREPHCLLSNIEKIKFYEKESRENIEAYIDSICECHNFLKEYNQKLKSLNNEDYLEFLSIKGIFNQDIDRGLYENISLKIIEESEKFSNLADTTPKEIGIIFNGILKVKENETCLDFAFGKGSLGIQVANKKIEGIEINPYIREFGNLMTKIANKDGHILKGDALKEKIEIADVVISNPPFGLNIDSKEDKEYLQWGNPLKSSDAHFISLALSKMKNRGAIIVPQGALFRGGAEGKVRNKIIESGFIEGIISLPNNILSFTSIPISIVFFRKDKTNDKIFMLDTTKEFFKKIRGGVTIEEENLKKIIEIYNQFKEIENISKFVNIKEILNNEGVLTVGRYIESKSEKVDSSKLIKELNEYTNKIDYFKKESDFILNKLIKGE